MQLSSAVLIYGLLVLAYGLVRVTFFGRVRADRSGDEALNRLFDPPTSVKRATTVPLSGLYTGFTVTCVGVMLSFSTSWYVHPIQGWLFGILAVSGLTVWGAFNMESKQPFPWQTTHRKKNTVDRSRVPAELAKILERKTGLPRKPGESDYDYVNRAREHVERKLERRIPDTDQPESSLRP